VDISDAQYESHMEAVRRIISELGLGEIPLLLVFNKTDRLMAEDLSPRCRGHDALCLSAIDRASTVPLLEAIEERLWREGVSVAGGP
jgi:GTP-binding protein HflX